MVQELPNGSLVRGELPEGCVICEKGAKMVLLVTGQCTFNCFYCPLSEEKQGRKVVYADELLVKDHCDIIFEANGISAEGTGITGGDPLVNMDEALEFIKLLKGKFGREHHIHLYTATPDKEKVKQLADAGLDEIRFHPPPSSWSRFSNTPYPEAIAAAKEAGMHAGLEVPALPDMKSEMLALIRSASEAGADFVNLNELEFSETNWRELKARGYIIKDDVSSAAMGSEKAARQIVKETELPISIHYCSASFKDGTQLRRRIMRRAENMATPLEIITDDGTFLKGIVECDNAEAMTKELAGQYDIPDDLIRYDVEKDRVEMAAWILEEIAAEIADEIDGQCFIVEEYPTADRLEVERQPV